MSPVRPGDGPRRPRWQGLAGLVAVGLAAVAVAGACGDVGEPDLGVAPAAPRAAASGALAAEPGTADDPTAASGAQLTPTRPDGFVPEVLVADDSGVRVLDGPVVLPGVVADRVVDDPTGGLVVEVPTGDGHQIVWYPSIGDGGHVVSDGDDRLLEVAFIDGSVQAVVGDDERIGLLPLDQPDSDARVLSPVAPETTATSVSMAAGRYAVVFQDRACGSLVVGLAGAPVERPVVPTPPCDTPGRPVHGLVAFSPDGATFAHTERVFRSDGVVASTDVVVRDVDGVERHRSPIGGEDEAVRSLSHDGDLVLVLRHTGAGTEVVRVRLDQPEALEVIPADGARWATFTRVPRALG